MGAKTISEAIVLRAVDYGEADRVVTLYAREVGKVSAIARGARRSRKRFGGALELFGAGQAVLAPRRGELWVLESFDARQGFPHLALDVAKVAHGAYLCELARELTPDHEPDPRVYELLEQGLGLLDRGEASAALLRAFELQLLDAVGLAPSLGCCVGCGAVVESGAGELFDVRRGGLVCGACAGGEASVRATARLLSDEARAAMALALARPLAEARSIAWGESAAPARDLLQAVLAEHLPRRLRSVDFIAKLRHG